MPTDDPTRNSAAYWAGLAELLEACARDADRAGDDRLAASFRENVRAVRVRQQAAQRREREAARVGAAAR